MIQTKIGNILDVNDGIIIHSVNAQGIMGGGVAIQIRNKYPAAYEAYLKHVGQPYTQQNSGAGFLGTLSWAQINTGLWVCNLVGQQFFGRDRRYTSYDALVVGLERAATLAKAYGARVHLPMIGAGLGGGKWRIIEQIVQEHLDGLDTTIWEFKNITPS